MSDPFTISRKLKAAIVVFSFLFVTIPYFFFDKSEKFIGDKKPLDWLAEKGWWSMMGLRLLAVWLLVALIAAASTYGIIYLVERLLRRRQQGDDATKDPPRLIVKFDDQNDKKQIGPIMHHRFGVFNPELPVAENVRAFLTEISPRPKAEIFPADFPYQLKSIDGGLSGHNINRSTLHRFELCQSWISGTTRELMVNGLDTRDNQRIPMQPSEVWHLRVEVSCANAPVESIFFQLTPGEKAVRVARIDVWPQVTPQPLVVAYNGGRYDHKVSNDGKLVYRVIRLQLENKSDQTINGIKVKAESFDSLGTIIPQVPLRICHDEHSNKKDGFLLTPGEKEMIDVVEKAIDWDVTRLCHPLSPDIVTRETDFKVTVVVTAENQRKQQKRLRIAVDDVEVLRCDALKT